MDSGLARVIGEFPRLKVLVVGEAMLDSHLNGVASRICREAPVPIVAVTSRHDAPGGAANTAANVCALGADVEFLSVIGDDEEGQRLIVALEERRVDPRHLVVEASRRTLAKHRVMASSHMFLRFDEGTTEDIGGEAEQQLAERLRQSYWQADAVIVSDYGYGVVTPRVLSVLKSLQAEFPRVLVVDSKNLIRFRDICPTAVKPNYGEALELLGLPDGACRLSAEAFADQGHRVLEATGAHIAAVTLDSDGALVFEAGGPPYRTYGSKADGSRVAGAGDSFVSGLALALASGADTPAAAELASAASAVVVAKDGTAICSASELREHVVGEGKYVDAPERLIDRIRSYQEQGKRVVFTNGCFDIIHRGHITYLSRAKLLGDILVVAVNSDDSVRRLKGPSRPINTIEDRLQVLAAMSCVDHVIAFSEDTPEQIIREIRPDVLVKGGDYTPETLPEAPLVKALGGTVEIFPYVEERSTTAIIDRIRQAVVVGSD